MPDVRIFPSLLSADFGCLQSEIDRFEPLEEGFHFDVMDGHFVPNLSMGAPILSRLTTKGIFDVHLMVSDPENYVEPFQKAGANMISFHIEAAGNKSSEIIENIQNLGMKAGIAMKPKTELSAIADLLDTVDFVLIMSVEPGFSGQSFISDVLGKVRTLRAQYPDIDIEIDGGISGVTVTSAREAGANLIVSGSYLFGSDDPEKAVKILRG